MKEPLTLLVLTLPLCRPGSYSPTDLRLQLTRPSQNVSLSSLLLSVLEGNSTHQGKSTRNQDCPRVVYVWRTAPARSASMCRWQVEYQGEWIVSWAIYSSRLLQKLGESPGTRCLLELYGRIEKRWWLSRSRSSQRPPFVVHIC